LLTTWKKGKDGITKPPILFGRFIFMLLTVILNWFLIFSFKVLPPFFELLPFFKNIDCVIPNIPVKNR